MHVQAEGAQSLGDEARGLVLLKTELWIGVDVVTPGHDLWRDGRHGIIVEHVASSHVFRTVQIRRALQRGLVPD